MAKGQKKINDTVKPGGAGCYLSEVVCKAWRKEKVELSLHSRYAEARKSAALVVKKV